MTADFLVEIGCEELPPKSLKELEAAFLDGITKKLQLARVNFSNATSFSTPRRLAVLVSDLDTTTPVEQQLIWGPPISVAFDADGKPTKAAVAFAQKNKIDINSLASHIGNDGKADKLCYSTESGGEKTSALLAGIITQSLHELPIAKRMRWGSKKAEFVRPVHWVVMLLDSEIVDATVLDINADRYTYGHRLSDKGKIAIAHASEYESLLISANVVPVFEKRKEIIKQQVKAIADEVNALAILDKNLLDEVTALVEWPVALFGRFDEKFLDIPQEALISSMSEHQKYFHLVNSKGVLVPGFITIANLESRDASKVIDGNERVIRPRLSDAAFFFETDKKTRLDARCEKLRNVVFQQKLGSLYDKAVRISKLGLFIADIIGANRAITERAGFLCKADLASDMVMEFDNMQGIAGAYYAINDGEDPAVATAIREHYLPRYSDDKLPTTLEACALALADRIDTLIGIFGLGQKPTGSKDPFALRRASIACLNIIVHHKLDIDLDCVLKHSFSLYDSLNNADDTVADVKNYMIERFRSWFNDDGIPVEVFHAVQAKSLVRPYDIYLRVLAVNAFSQLDAAQALAAANKRVANILAKFTESQPAAVDKTLLELDAEVELAELIEKKKGEILPLVSLKDYKSILFTLAELRPAVDAYFDHVMVMTDDINLRKNRVALLIGLQNLFMQVADISCLVPEKNHG